MTGQVSGIGFRRYPLRSLKPDLNLINQAPACALQGHELAYRVGLIKQRARDLGAKDDASPTIRPPRPPGHRHKPAGDRPASLADQDVGGDPASPTAPAASPGAESACNARPVRSGRAPHRPPPRLPMAADGDRRAISRLPGPSGPARRVPRPSPPRRRSARSDADRTGPPGRACLPPRPCGRLDELGRRELRRSVRNMGRNSPAKKTLQDFNRLFSPRPINSQ